MPTKYQFSALSKTALAPAMVRAMESRRPDRLFDDPYAQAFVDAAPDEFPEASKAAMKSTGARREYAPAPGAGANADLGALFYAHAVLRTWFFDNHLTSANVRQIVLLAAGLDTRAFRLQWPAGTTVFELDLPDVLSFKDAVLDAHGGEPGCKRVTVPGDLRGDWPAALIAAEFDPAEPTAWLAEGLLVYMSAAEAAHMLGRVTDLSAPDSSLAAERTSLEDPATRDRLLARPETREYAKLYLGGLGADTTGWLTSHGWAVRAHRVEPLAAQLGRPLPPHAEGGYMTAVRLSLD